MKFRNLLNLVLLLIVGQLLFACNSAEYYKFAPQKPEAYNKAKAKPATAPQEEAPSLSVIALEAADEKATKQAEEPVLEANAAATAPVIIPKKTVKAVEIKEAATPEVKTVTEAEALEMAKERLANMTKAEKKEFKKEVKEAFKQDRVGRTSIVEIILAILLPPLAVFLHDGIGTSFWISIILTLLFWLPGVIYALLVVTDSI